LISPPGKKQRKGKRYEKSINGLSIQLSKLRGDVVLKAILRHMRKGYLEEFNKSTNYIKNKRYAEPKYLIECLEIYIQERFPESFSNDGAIPSSDSISFFLGSIFYPKIMKGFYDKPSTCAAIDKLHMTLYSFSTSKLKDLSSSDVYKFIFKDFCTNFKDDLLEKNKTIQKEKADYASAFNYLIKFSNL
jgi:hypothetical protein